MTACIHVSYLEHSFYFKTFNHDVKLNIYVFS